MQQNIINSIEITKLYMYWQRKKDGQDKLLRKAGNITLCISALPNTVATTYTEVLKFKFD